MRKQILIPLLAVAVGSLVAVSAVAKDITVISWGGAYTKSQTEAYYKPWIAETGNNINSADYNGGLAEVKAQVETGNVSWDVVDLEKSDLVQGCDEGLFEPLDLTALPAGSDGKSAEADFLDGSLSDCGVANIVWSTIFAYDESKYPAGTPRPKTIEDLFNVEKFPGKRGLRKGPKANLEMALMGDGVPADEVYDLLKTPEGINRAFAKLDSVKDHVIWWEAGSQPPQLLADGEVVMATAYNGRIFNAAVAENKPFVTVWDGQILDFDFYAIPKGSQNKELAFEFIKFATGTEPLARQASYISYGPARRSSAPFVGKHAETGVEMAPHMPTAPANLTKALPNNFDFWADHADELNERFNAWLAN